MDDRNIRVAVYREAWRTVGGTVDKAQRVHIGECYATPERLSDTTLPGD